MLIELGEARAADAMVDSVMPQVLECEDAGLNARCFGVLGDAQVGMAGALKREDHGSEGLWKEARARRLHKAVDYCERAFSGMYSPKRRKVEVTTGERAGANGD